MRRLESGFGVLEFRGLPCIVAAGEVGDVAEACAAKDARSNGAAVAAFAVDDEELSGIEFCGVPGELT